ncbi:MAG: hypothetical protein LUH05_04825 [Candidatus Gastranaerophilales bacterium]|nr:hypothetical protein [Candidatus Gastranaerophilales bacterium]
MKKILFILVSLVYICISPSIAQVIEGNIAMTDKVPEEFFGDWKVVSVCTKSTNREYFDSTSMDLWTLRRQGDLITLMNPLSGARADITVNDVKGKTVKFEKRTSFPDEESIETPILTLQGDNFTGVDKISIKTFKDGKLIKEDYVEYQVRGTKISGSPISGIFGQ